jgi:hypothetical protein
VRLTIHLIVSYCYVPQYFLRCHLLNQNFCYLPKFKYFFFLIRVFFCIWNQSVFGFDYTPHSSQAGDWNTWHCENDWSKTDRKFHVPLFISFLNLFEYTQLILYLCQLLGIQARNLKTCLYQQMSFTLFLLINHRYLISKTLLRYFKNQVMNQLPLVLTLTQGIFPLQSIKKNYLK